MDLVGIEDLTEFIKSYEAQYRLLLNAYPDEGTQFAFDVLFTKKYIMGRDVKLACIRHFQDLLRQQDDDFPYKYNLDFVHAIFDFARMCPDPISEKPIEPMGWQYFILGSLIGWRNTNTGGSRFHESIVSMARSQGKTWLASILMNFYYFVVAANESNQDFLIASNKKDQAKKLFKYVSTQAAKLVQLDEFREYAEEQRVTINFNEIIAKGNKNTIAMGSAEAGGFDSRHNILAVFDEIGDLPPSKNEMLNQITSGQSLLANGMFLQISTAYPDVKVKFKSDQDRYRTLIEQDYSRNGDDIFMIIFSQDSEEEVMNPELFEKSNPLLGNHKMHDVLLDNLIKDRNKKEADGELASFVNKSLNLWSRKFQNSFLSLANIQQNVDDDFNIDGRDVYIGFDASMTNDNTSFAFEYPYINGNDQLFGVTQYSFIPFAQAKTLEAKSKQDNLDYLALEQQGYCEITDLTSGTIDRDQVYNWLVSFVENHSLNVKGVIADPNLADWFVNKITNYQPDWPMMTLRPTSQNLSTVTKDLQEMFINKRMTIHNDPLLIDGLNNAILVTDRGGGIKIDRQNRTSQHIDTADALINAHWRAQYHFEDYEEQEQNPLNLMNTEQKKDYFKHLFS